MPVKVIDNVSLDWDTDPTHSYILAEVNDPNVVLPPYSTITRDDGIYIVVGMLKNEITPLQIYYPAHQGFTKASVEANPILATVAQECKMCGRVNKYFNTKQPSTASSQEQVIPNKSTSISNDQPSELRTMDNNAYEPSRRESGSLSSIAKLVNVGQNICCRPGGRIITSALASEFARKLADDADDPGLRDSIGGAADTFAENISIREDQRDELRNDLIRGYETYRKTGSVAEAVKTVMFRGVGDMLKDGVKLTKTEVKQTTYNVIPAGSGNMIR